MDIFKSIIKDIFTNEITLKTIVILCYVSIAIIVYHLLDLTFIF